MPGIRWILTPDGQRLAWLTEQNWVLDAQTKQVIGYLSPDNNCVWPRGGGPYIWYLKGAWLHTPDGQRVGYISGEPAEPRRPADEEE